MTNSNELTFITRIEEREAEKRAISEDIRDIYKEAKDAGLNVKVMRARVRLRKMDEDQRGVWREALGDLFDLPLGRVAIEREARRA